MQEQHQCMVCLPYLRPKPSSNPFDTLKSEREKVADLVSLLLPSSDINTLCIDGMPSDYSKAPLPSTLSSSPP